MERTHCLEADDPGFWMEEFKEGDAKVFGEFFHKYYTPICYFAKQIIGDPEAAKDIAAEIFMKIWMGRQQFDSILALQSFLYISARNACLNYIKRSKVAAAYNRSIIFRVEGQSMDDLVLHGIYHKEVRGALKRAIELLPAQCKRVLKLSLDGMKTNEIASTLNISPQTVRNTRGRAKELLKDLLTEDMTGILVLQRTIEFGWQN